MNKIRIINWIKLYGIIPLAIGIVISLFLLSVDSFLIICLWVAIWSVFLILKFKQIKELINPKDCIGIFGLYIITLGLIFYITEVFDSQRMFNTFVTF